MTIENDAEPREPGARDESPNETDDVVDFPTAKTRRPKRRRPDPNDPRPVIHLKRGDIERIVDEAECALIAAKRGVFQRDGLIVSVVEAPAIAFDGAKIFVQRIAEIGDYALIEHLDRAACFVKYDARAKAEVVVDPPTLVAKTLRERKGRRFPILAGVINAPTLRADGSPLETPGFDEATGLIFDPRGVEFPLIQWKPTRDHGRAALTTLEDVIKDFPFLAEVDRSVALSAQLTSFVRRSLPSAPMHAVSATAAGAGKSKLVDIASVIATGEKAPVVAAGKSEEELEKRLGALLLAGATIIAIDNIEAPLGGELLCQTLTQERVRPRILGKSHAPETSTGASIFATGNGLVLAGDLTRRSLLSRLDAQCERPELRTFDRDPVEYAKANRPGLVAAALTVLHAYNVAGRPNKPTPLGSFEAWSELVRGALLWLGCADPAESMETVRQSDPVRASLATVIAQWKAVLGFDRVTVAQVIDRAIEMHDNVFVHPELRDALLKVAGEGGALNSRVLGNWLATHKGRILGGLRFEQPGSRQGVALWQLATVE